ncbi:LuxR C-terminal-related transcriptional regulator [Roseateles koreensis]|uniref:LuxR C-terminal-related transcriptional regulator n=1 Tax=Roseateles koreensis TaxID=2987526 RepID=A0ABT5KTZ7_9BURK|nr:LuxR family transcriptional regulator [Roseateles koreensis]MDC8786389.1 LuxR C-terminal-related transcriptional regulator [Roseateles koreensis]
MPAPTTAASEIDALIASPNWHRSFGALVDMLDKPGFWTVLIRYLRDAVAFDNWVALVFHRDARPEVCAESPAAGGGNDLLFKDYLESFYLLDPFYLASCDEPRAGLFRIDDVAPDNYEAEDYYQRYFQFNIVKDEVQFNLPLDKGGVLSLSLGAARRFTADDMCVLSAITPWMLALMRQRMRFEARPLEGAVEAALRGTRSAEALHETQHEAPHTAEREPGVVNMPLGLTAREVQIVHLMLSGHSSKGIAQKLQISPETVKAHRRHIYTKMGVRSHPELFSILIQAGALPMRRPPEPDL